MKMIKKKLYRVLIAIGIAVSSFSLIVSVQAENLILEWDEDEPSTFIQEENAQKKQEVPQVNNSEKTVGAHSSGQPQYNQELLKGYQQLFLLNADDQEKLKSNLKTINEEFSSIDTELFYLEKQQTRLKDLFKRIQQRTSTLKEIQAKQFTQLKLLELEKEDARKQFELLVNLSLRLYITRLHPEEDGYSLKPLSNSRQENSISDYLLKQMHYQLQERMRAVDQQELQLKQLIQKQYQAEQELKLLGENLIRTQKSIDEQLAYKKQLQQGLSESAEKRQQQLNQAIADQKEIRNRLYQFNYSEVPVYVNSGVETLIWPVNPLLGISAGFRDSSYKKRFGLEHNAIDIPTDQLTPIKAALSGKVTTVRDAGLGYNYIQLVHADGYSTVYGHVYDFLVEEGDFVQQGQIIARSGGAIGTKGAGRLTTGPHLHFEVLKNGRHIDPETLLKEK